MRLRRSASSVLTKRPAASSADLAAEYGQCAGTKEDFGEGHSEGSGLFQPGPMPAVASRAYSSSMFRAAANSAFMCPIDSLPRSFDADARLRTLHLVPGRQRR